MFFKKLKIILLPILALLIFIIVSVFILNALISTPSVRHYLLSRLSASIGYELRAKDIELSFWKGVGINVSGLDAISLTGAEKIQVSNIKITLQVRELLRGNLIPTNLVFVRPQIQLDSPFGPRALPGRRKIIWQTLKQFGRDFQKIYIRKFAGLLSLSIEDAKVSINDLPFDLDSINFDLVQRSEIPLKLDITLDGRIGLHQEKISLQIKGSITQDTDEKGLAFAEAVLKTSDVPLTWIKWPSSFPVEKGSAEIRVKIWGPLTGPMSSRGQVRAKDLDFLIVGAKNKKSFYFKRFAIAFDTHYSESILQISSLQLKSENVLMSASSRIDFGEPSNPYLAFSVKAPFMPLGTFQKIFPSPLLPSWLEARLFPLFTKGDVRLDLFSLNGRLNQIRNLHLAKNATLLTLKLTCMAFNVLEGKPGLPFTGVSGVVKIEKGTLSVSNVLAGFGKSSLKKGSFNVSSLYGADRTFHILFEGDFSLEDLLRQRKIDLIPVDLRRKLQGFESAAGRLKTGISISYDSALKYLKIREGTFQLVGGVIQHKGLILPLVLTRAELEIKGEKNRRFQGIGQWGKTKIQFSGSVGALFQFGEVKVSAKADVNEIADILYQGRTLLGKFQTPVPLQFTLFKRKRIWASRGEIALNDVRFEAGSLFIAPVQKDSRILFDIELDPGKKVDFKRLRLHTGESSLQMAGSYDLKDKDTLSLRVSTDRLAVEDLGIRFKTGNLRVYGFFAFNAVLKISRKNLELTELNGKIAAQGLSLFSAALPWPIVNSNFKLRFSDPETHIESMNLQLGQNRLSIQGRLKEWRRLKGELMISTSRLDFSDWITHKTGDAFNYNGSALGRFINKSDLRIKLKAGKGQFENIKYGPLEVQGAFRSGDIYITNSDIQLEHGTLRVKGHVKRGKTPETLLSGYIKLTKQPLKELPQQFDGLTSRLEGLLTLEGFFFTRGGKKEDLISSLNGGMNILIEKGMIKKKSHVIFEIFEFLSLKNLFKKRPETFSKEGFYFETIMAHITIDNGVLGTDSLMMKSPIFNGITKGKMDLADLRVDAEMGVQPLGTVDFLISNIPIVGYILTGKEKSLLVYYFKVEGLFPTPDVRYVPLENLGKSTFGFFKRLFFTPGRIFKDISEVSQEFSQNEASDPSLDKENKMDQTGP